MIGEIAYGVVGLDLVKMNEVRRDVIFSDDGVDYLYTRIRLNLTCILNPAATSFNGIAGDIPTPGNAFAGRTDRCLFDYLSQPRRTLKIWVYDADGSRRTYLETPPQNARTRLPPDAKNGPFCKVFAINGANMHGAKTWMLNLEFETFVNNCLDGTSPVLSFRWEKNVDYDDQFTTIVTTRGHVVFHAGRLWGAGQSPDHYRELFIGGPPPGFARDHLSIQVGSDNCSASFTAVDAERYMSVGETSPACRVEAMLTSWFRQGSVGAAVAQTAPTVFESLTGGMSSGALTRPVTSFAGHMQSQLPVYGANIRVRVHGARQSPRLEMYKLAICIAFSRLGAPNFFGLANKCFMTVSQELASKSLVELDMSLAWTEQVFTQLAGVAGPMGSVLATAGLIARNAASDTATKYLDSYFLEGSAAANANNPYGNETHLGRADTNALMTKPGGYQTLLRNSGGTVGGELNLLTQRALVGNRSMYAQRTDIANDPNLVALKHSRSPAYIKYLLTAALLQPCETPAMPGEQDEVLNPASPQPSVSPISIPLLPVS